MDIEIVYVNTEAPGAWKNKTRVRKCHSDPGDGHAEGAVGTIVGSIRSTPFTVTIKGEVKSVTYFYFVVFDNERFPIGMVDYKLEPL